MDHSTAQLLLSEKPHGFWLKSQLTLSSAVVAIKIKLNSHAFIHQPTIFFQGLAIGISLPGISRSFCALPFHSTIITPHLPAAYQQLYSPTNGLLGNLHYNNCVSRTGTRVITNNIPVREPVSNMYLCSQRN